ncbi:MAG: STAS domain-containing protein [Planctomycetota bacterium]|nr:STAS domain-containing protein [Planctomycetota bacterium]
MLEDPRVQSREEDGNIFLEFLPPDCVFNEDAVKTLYKQFEEIIDGANSKRFVIDFANVQYMSSTVLGVLVSTLLKIQKQGGELRITGVDRDLKQVFRLTGLHRIFRICDTLDGAIKSFDTPAPPAQD